MVMPQGKEVVDAIYAFGEWNDVIQGTFRKIGGGPPVLGDECYTWIERGDPSVRRYARTEAIMGVQTVTPEIVA